MQLLPFLQENMMCYTTARNWTWKPTLCENRNFSFTFHVPIRKRSALQSLSLPIYHKVLQYSASVHLLPQSNILYCLIAPLQHVSTQMIFMTVIQRYTAIYFAMAIMLH